MKSEQTRRYIDLTEKGLDRYLTGPDGSVVVEAMRYSTLDAGKRVRASLVLGVCEMLGGRIEDALPYACAIEMVHAYSLIHDDLPCMDNDDLRRGKPSCHKQFSESTAMLAGDALLTKAFEIACTGAVSPLDAVLTLAQGAGADGMIYGQELDLAAEGRAVSEQELERVHRHKTGALLRASARLGALAAGADANTLAAIDEFAAHVGLVFQIVDDVLDCTATTEQLGKPVGSDAENKKTTYVTLLGIEGARDYAKMVNKRATDALASFGHRADYLVGYADSLLKRMW